MLAYAVTIFISAFLLFQVQPLIAKFILPWFGGSPAVWTTSMLFFQVFLLGGYIYAHLSTKYLSRRAQVIVHLVLLALAATQLPIIPPETLKPTGAETPIWHVLTVLAISVGFPYFTLSATAPLLQAWFARTHEGRSPYRLYALSNFASFLALLSYPFVFEPTLTRITQAISWSIGYGVFGIGIIVVAVTVWRAAQAAGADADAANDAEDASPPRWTTRLIWTALAATASVLLLAFTNQMTEDISSIPFLWVVPLSLYLLTFVIAFDNERWYVRPVFAALLIPSWVGVIWILFALPDVNIIVLIVVFSLALFVFCMVCHGELARLKPHPRYLTSFYLNVSLGGALGGVIVAILAPLVFNTYLELPLSLLAVGVLAAITYVMLRDTALLDADRGWVWPTTIGVLLVLQLAVMAVGFIRHPSILARTRNFYGQLEVWDAFDGTPQAQRFLLHGDIMHGIQFTSTPARSQEPTSYYAVGTAVGDALDFVSAQGEKRVGVVGLGIGTLLAYGEPGDYFALYEINPEVVDLAEDYFTYLDQAEADYDIFLGDGRLSLENQPPQDFDILVLDAFSGDAIPTHLVTREAMAEYLRHVNDDGIIAFNVTNRHIDLEPVLRDLALYYGLEAYYYEFIDTLSDIESEWMLLTANEDFRTFRTVDYLMTDNSEAEYDPVRPWTDDYTSIFAIIQ